MGREHHLSRNPPLRETGYRRQTRVPDALRLRCHALSFPSDTPLAGIDVGEDFLDLGILTRGELSFRRVALAGLDAPASVSALARRLAESAPELSRGAIAIVDSPRCPLDVDSSSASMKPRLDAPTRRAIDIALRRLFASAGKGRLSMYPTPRAEYFARCVSDASCKPHLRAIGLDLLGSCFVRSTQPSISRGGLLFTRFMLAGFAAHAALARLGVRAFEGYPEMEFRLWSETDAIPSKRKRLEALTSRRRICSRLATVAGISRMETPATLDQTDAAALALSVGAAVVSGTLIELRSPAEGRFLVAFEGAGRTSLLCSSINAADALAHR